MQLVKFGEIKQVFMASGIVGVQRMMKEKLGQWKEVKVNFAVLGNSGAGKSSFINAIRG
jgi:putative ribosome biogenesis GTPase RsgA